MTIYVDNMEWPFRNMIMCHLFSDTSIEELCKFADSIGVNRKWLQQPDKCPHFDICKSKRKLAVEKGAVEIEYGTNKEWLRVYEAAKNLRTGV